MKNVFLSLILALGFLSGTAYVAEQIVITYQHGTDY